MIYNSALLAEWQSGHAADCKSVHAGSIPTSASKFKYINLKIKFSYKDNHLSKNISQYLKVDLGS